MDWRPWMDAFLPPLLEALPGRVAFVGIQGSFGRGEAGPESDVDLVVVLDALGAAETQAPAGEVRHIQKKVNRRLRRTAVWAACIVLASGGYPLAYEKGKEITGLENGQVPGAADVTVYHAGTAIKDGKLVTNGGRVLGVTATAATLPEALKKAYAAADCIHFDKLHRRSDIGARALAAMKAQEG